MKGEFKKIDDYKELGCSVDVVVFGDLGGQQVNGYYWLGCIFNYGGKFVQFVENFCNVFVVGYEGGKVCVFL